jgi:hypothetical protein
MFHLPVNEWTYRILEQQVHNNIVNNLGFTLINDTFRSCDFLSSMM